MEKFVSTMYDAITQGMEKEFPERVAFRYYTEETDMVTTVLFKELAQDVRRTVTCLQSTIPDVKGKKICLLSKNSYEYVVNTFGAIMAGCVLVPMNQRKSWDELPKEAKAYVEFLEKQLGHEIQFVSTGAEREKFVLKGEWL